MYVCLLFTTKSTCAVVPQKDPNLGYKFLVHSAYGWVSIGMQKSYNGYIGS